MDAHKLRESYKWPVRDQATSCLTKEAYSTCKKSIGTFLIIAILPLASNATERVSVSSTGVEGDGASGFFGPNISANGRFIVFDSGASNFGIPEGSVEDQTFIHDRETGLTSIASINSSGSPANWSMSNFLGPDISGDGEHVLFETRASNLVPGDSNDREDVFVHNLRTGVTERVSVTSAGGEGNDGSARARISANGRFVAFTSQATNLAPGDTSETWDVFVHDRNTGVTERVSVDSDGNEAISDTIFGSQDPGISSDGRYVVFQSRATNLVASDDNAGPDVFIRDRTMGTTKRISFNESGDERIGGGSNPQISNDGRFVTFSSGARDLVPGDTNEAVDVFVYDMSSDQFERISIDSDGNETNPEIHPGAIVESISANGRYVTFSSSASDMVAQDTNSTWDAFVHDRQTGLTERISIDSVGNEGNDLSSNPMISADGRYVAFTSKASNLVAGDGNEDFDVFAKAVNFAPSITSATSKTVAGDSPAIMALTATDTEGDEITFEIVGGTDQALVTVNASTGEFSFISAPDFESPADANGDNIYEVQVRARDAAGGTGVQSFQDLRITVENTVEPCASLVLGRWATIGSDCRTRGVVEIGNFSRVGNNADLGDGTVVGGYARIGNDFTTGSNVQVGSFSHIGDRVSVGSNSTLGRYLRIGNDVVIGERSNIDQFSRISNNVEIGNDVVINRNVVIGDNVNVRDNTHIDQFARIGANSVIENNVEIGRNVRIGQGSTIGANTRIERFANIGNNVRIGSNVTIGQYARISNNAVVPDGSVIGAFETFRP